MGDFHRAAQVGRAVGLPRIDPVRDVLPGGRVLLQPVAEERMLTAIAGQDGEKATVARCDRLHIFQTAQFAIGDIQKVRPSRQRAQNLPSRKVGVYVCGVAIE
jgi:hypothetical protein